MAHPQNETLFPTLAPEQVASLAPLAVEETHPDGAVLFDQGDRVVDFFVVLEGGIDIVQDHGEAEFHIVRHGPGQFSGDTDLLSGRAVIVKARAAGPTRVLRIAPRALQRLIVENSELSDIILRAFLSRRAALLEGGHSSLQVIGSRYDSNTHRLRDFLSRNALPHQWIDVEKDDGVEAMLEKFGVTPEEMPVVLNRGRDLYRNPSNADVAACLGLDAVDETEVSDVLVVGAGPAGLASAVYAASEGLSVTAIDSHGPGGQAGTSSKIENYLGFPTGISGAELARAAYIQAQKFGARIATNRRAVALDCSRPVYEVTLEDGTLLRARAVVVATGARYRKLAVPAFEQYEDAGIHYGATAMEALLCDNETVIIVGGGNSAGQAAVYLSRFARQVYILIRRDRLDHTMSRYLVRRIDETPNIELKAHTEVAGVAGDNGRLARVTWKNNQSGAEETINCGRLFCFIGAAPNTDWLSNCVATDEKGFVLTGDAIPPMNLVRSGWSLDRSPTLFETSRPRVYAVGDVRATSTKRVASAVGEGSIVVAFIHKALEEGAG